jgi:acetylornithine deacetylase/succinyl-diaminopimelate desuccinylase-like protein
VEIQQIPAKTFHEQQRGQFIYTTFQKSGLKNSFIDAAGNVYAQLKGRGERQPLVVSAHLDTVFPPGTDLTVKRSSEKITGPGIGDNSLGVAGLFGLYWALGVMDGGEIAPSLLAGDVWLVANVAEEGLGNLAGMKAVVDRFGKGALAYIVLEGMSLGQIYHRGLGVRRYRIKVHTKGGHSWVDYGSPSAIHQLAEIVVKFSHLALPVQPRTSLNVGLMSGGTSVNTIAADAHLELDLRSTSITVLEGISRQVEALVDEADRRGREGSHAEAEVIGTRPAGEIPSDHPLVKLAVESYAANGIRVKLNIGSTDTNEPLSRGFPAICVGLTSGGGAHTLDEYIDTKPVSQGLKSLVDLVRSIFERGISA